MISQLSVFQYVSMSLRKRVFSKTAHRIFLKLLMKLGYLQGKKLTDLGFLEKNTIFLDNAQKHPKVRVFWILQKNSPFMCRFFGFKS